MTERYMHYHFEMRGCLTADSYLSAVSKLDSLQGVEIVALNVITADEASEEEVAEIKAEQERAMVAFTEWQAKEAKRKELEDASRDDDRAETDDNAS